MTPPPPPGCPHRHRSRGTWGEMERWGDIGELGRTQRGSMGLAPIHSAPYTDRGGPIASMSLYGALQLPYSGPIAAPQPGCPHSHRSQRTWGEMERLGVNGELGST